MINACGISFVKPDGTRPLGIHSRRWKHNVTMGLTEIECLGVDWIHVDRDETCDGLLKTG
jgi:hypothetical protein